MKVCERFFTRSILYIDVFKTFSTLEKFFTGLLDASRLIILIYEYISLKQLILPPLIKGNAYAGDAKSTVFDSDRELFVLYNKA